jgi:hypothetical protein
LADGWGGLCRPAIAFHSDRPGFGFRAVGIAKRLECRFTRASGADAGSLDAAAIDRLARSRAHGAGLQPRYRQCAMPLVLEARRTQITQGVYGFRLPVASAPGLSWRLRLTPATPVLFPSRSQAAARHESWPRTPAVAHRSKSVRPSFARNLSDIGMTAAPPQTRRESVAECQG